VQRQHSSPSSWAELVAALGPFRPIEGRLTGGFKYASYTGKPPSRRQERLLRSYSRSLQKRDTPQVRQDKAFLALLADQPEEFISYIRQELSKRPADARLWLDLSAAYLARAVGKNRSLDLVRSLDAVNKSLRYNPTLGEAHFNRALILERLMLTEQAWSEWVWYVRTRKRGEWLAEARQHLLKLQSTTAQPAQGLDTYQLDAVALRHDISAVELVVSRSPWAVKHYGEEELLESWAKAYLTNSTISAARLLSIARAIGDSLGSMKGDLILRDTIQSIDRSDDRSLKILARGLLALGKGRKLYQRGSYEESNSSLLLARRAFKYTRNPLVLRVDFWIACTAVYSSRYSDAIKRLIDIQRRANLKSYRSLEGEAFWMIGVASFSSGDTARAAEAYKNGLGIFTDLGYYENIAAVQGLFSELLDYQGAAEEAWRYRYEALRMSAIVGNPVRLYQIYSTSAIASMKQGYINAAISFQEGAVREARKLNNPVALAWSLLWRGRYRQKLGQAELALKDLMEARTISFRLSGDIAKRLSADLLFAEAELRVPIDPQHAIQLLGPSLEYYLASKNMYNLLDAYLLRARAYQAVGRIEAAAKDYEYAITSVDRWRSEISEPDKRQQFMELEESAFYDMIKLQIVLGRPEQAFDFLERWRSRNLLDLVYERSPNANSDDLRWHKRISPVATLSHLERHIPAGAVVVSYAIIGSQLAIWVIGQTGIEAFKLTPGGSDLRILISSFKGELLSRAPQEDLRRTSYDLYQILMAPIKSFILPNQEVVFVCDEVLQSFPFSALWNSSSSSGSYLVETNAYIMSPSLNVYVLSASKYRTPAKGWRAAKFLAVGNPGFSREEFPELSPLRHAREEATETAKLYENSRTLVDEHANKTELLRIMRYFDIIQYSGHAIAGDASGMRPSLVLAPVGRLSAGRLTDREIIDSPALSANLAVLVSCETEGGVASRSEGVESMARSFVAAGVPVVIGSLWSLDDDRSMKFLVNFHQLLQGGVSPARALCIAQRNCLRRVAKDCEAPSAWAAFQAMGGEK
jgi:CHAT domain-containing protein